jgi:antitoxin component of RelBE/YafQ-DinJ toxin-antitoxin module
MLKDAGLRIRVEKDLREAFVQACKFEGESASNVIRNFMQTYVDYEVKQRQPDLFKLEDSNQ